MYMFSQSEQHSALDEGLPLRPPPCWPGVALRGELVFLVSYHRNCSRTASISPKGFPIILSMPPYSLKSFKQGRPGNRSTASRNS
eukprot:1325595-Rhodomonas_salina.3